jgi:hypothetical protein
VVSLTQLVDFGKGFSVEHFAVVGFNSDRHGFKFR